MHLVRGNRRHFLWHHDPRNDIGDDTEQRQRAQRQSYPDDSHERYVYTEVAREPGANSRDLALLRQACQSLGPRWSPCRVPPCRVPGCASALAAILHAVFKVGATSGTEHGRLPLYHQTSAATCLFRQEAGEIFPKIIGLRAPVAEGRLPWRRW